MVAVLRSIRLAAHTALPVAGLLAALVAAGCGARAAGGSSGSIQAVGAENEYANVISQVGGRYVQVSAVMSNPNTDPHTFEASSSVAREVSAANLVVQNGLGYDTFMNTIEKASPDAGRKVIDVQSLLGLADSAPNPHLWYDPATMPAVAKQIATDLSAIDPAHAAYYRTNETTFDAALAPWMQAIQSFKASYPGAPVATTEPVADDLLQAMGTDDLTPLPFQADIMNGIDPAPQDVTNENTLLSQHKVKVLAYNQQVTDSLTQGFVSTARTAGIPVVGVYETMPAGDSYQSWMLAETQA
ncbi:MAG: metal ABC transporter solute-binding protein, Zn/Mn family, partial [Actinomycetota bacterium]